MKTKAHKYLEKHTEAKNTPADIKVDVLGIFSLHYEQLAWKQAFIFNTLSKEDFFGKKNAYKIYSPLWMYYAFIDVLYQTWIKKHFTK